MFGTEEILTIGFFKQKINPFITKQLQHNLCQMLRQLPLLRSYQKFL